MSKNILILLLSVFLLISCSKKSGVNVLELTDEEKAVSIYDEAVAALKTGDAFFAGKKFKEVETLMPQSKWAAKASLMSGYSDYSRNAYTSAVFKIN